MRSAGGEGRGRGCWQKASIIDILPRSTTVTDRRKFSPAQGPSLSERYLRREPSPPLSPWANKKIGRQSFAAVKTKSVDDGSTITVCSRPGPWSCKRGKEGSGGGRLENRDDNPFSLPPPRFQRWSNTLSLSSNVRGILKDVCEKRIFLSSPFENVSERRDGSFIYFLFSLVFSSFLLFFGTFLDEQSKPRIFALVENSSSYRYPFLSRK